MLAKRWWYHFCTRQSQGSIGAAPFVVNCENRIGSVAHSVDANGACRSSGICSCFSALLLTGIMKRQRFVLISLDTSIHCVQITGIRHLNRWTKRKHAIGGLNGSILWVVLRQRGRGHVTRSCDSPRAASQRLGKPSLRWSVTPVLEERNGSPCRSWPFTPAECYTSLIS